MKFNQPLVGNWYYFPRNISVSSTLAGNGRYFQNMFSIFLLLLSVTFVNSVNLNDVVSKFHDEKCIEDDFIDPDLLAHAADPWQSTIYDKAATSRNSLSLIHELSILNKIEYYYYLEKEEGPNHAKTFHISLRLGDEVYKGDGMSLKEAKRHAADEALLHTDYIIPEVKEKHKITELTPTVELNNVATKLGMKVTYLSQDELEAERLIYKQKNITIPGTYKTHLDKLNHSTYHPYETKKLDVPKENQQGKQFKVGVIVGQMRFIGVGYTLQSAKHDAAKNALIGLSKLSVKDIEQCVEEGVVCNPDNNKSPISVLYELAQEKGIHLNFEVTDDNGRPHEKVFTTTCQFGDLTVEGSGKSKKLAKRSASENMLERLKHTAPSEVNTDVTIKKISKKKKKKKVIKSSLEKFSIDAKNFVTSTWDALFSDEDDKMDDAIDDRKGSRKESGDGGKGDFKQFLLELVQQTGISAHFIDLGIEESKHYSLLFLGLEPKHVCLGDGSSYDYSRQKASLEALNFLQKLGITNMIPDQETFDYIKNMDFGKMYMIADEVASENENVKEE